MFTNLNFKLDIQDNWPPVGSESLPFEREPEGFRSLEPPLFIKGLSVGDVIEVDLDSDGHVSSWSHRKRSDHSTIWLLRLEKTDEIRISLEKLRSLGCNTVSQDQLGCYSVDVPGSIKLSKIDEILDKLDSGDVAIAFPSLRHSE